MSDEIRHHIDDIPEGAIPTGVIEIVSYIYEGGKGFYAIRVGGDEELSKYVGLLEFAKLDIIEDFRSGD